MQKHDKVSKKQGKTDTMQDWAIILTFLGSLIIILGVTMFIAFKYLERKAETFPQEIIGKIKSGRGVVGRIQKELDAARDMDISKFIEQNPVVVDVFPTLIEKATQRDAQPQMINSIVQLLAPAVIGLITNNANAPDALKAIAGSGGATILSGIFKALGAFREKAKENYKPGEKKEGDKTKKVHSAPKVESI